MKIAGIFLFLASIFSACSKPNADSIVNKSIAYHQMDKLKNSTLEFTFRNFRVKAMQKDGRYKYERLFTDSTGKVHDILTNSEFKRLVNDQQVKLDTASEAKYSRSINSLVYFTFLPLKLNDEAVQKKYLGETKIKGKDYYKIEVSFRKEGGGKDFEDVYYYWFDTQDYSMDYLAYSAGGNRMREVLKQDTVSGIIFQDYINYQSPLGDSITPVIKYDSLLNAGKLRELSRIEMTDIVV
ncbi:MAG: DUF6503 family protein, partial [Daejeonella sp.]